MEKVLILHILFLYALISSAQTVVLQTSNGTVVYFDTWAVVPAGDKDLMKSVAIVGLTAEEKLTFSYFDEANSEWRRRDITELHSESGFTTSAGYINVSISGCYELSIVLDFSNISEPLLSVYETKSDLTDCSPKKYGDTAAVACDSLVWYGKTYYTSGEYKDTLVNVAGGDSILTLHLTLNQATVASVPESYSGCDVVTVYGKDYFVSGTYTDTLVNAAGCDSIVTLYLTINNTSMRSESAKFCEFEVYKWHDQWLTTSGDYTDTLLSAAGCDSIVILTLKVDPTCFSNVEGITETTATLKWLRDSAVTQYDINVYTGGVHFAQYIVDGNGQIISSRKFAPSVYHHKLDTTTSSTEVFVILLDGLSAGTEYTYTIDGTNAENDPIYYDEGSFTTLNEGKEGLFDIISDDPRKQTQKILLHNGQVFILRGEKVYTLQGQEVE